MWQWLNKIPVGKIGSLSLAFLALVTIICTFYTPSDEYAKIFFFMSLTLLFIILMIALYSGWIPCKERLSDLIKTDKKKDEQVVDKSKDKTLPKKTVQTKLDIRMRHGKFPHLCPRCTGFWIGIVIFAIIIGLIRLYVDPTYFSSIPKEFGYLFIVIGIALIIPTIIHGYPRRKGTKKGKKSISANLYLFFTGFISASGAFFIFLFFIILFPPTL